MIKDRLLYSTSHSYFTGLLIYQPIYFHPKKQEIINLRLMARCYEATREMHRFLSVLASFNEHVYWKTSQAKKGKIDCQAGCFQEEAKGVTATLQGWVNGG